MLLPKNKIAPTSFTFSKVYYIIPLVFCLAFSSCKFLETVFAPNDDTSTETEATVKKGNANFDYWVHSPFHPSNKTPITFATSIKENKGIQKVELFIYEYELYRNENDLPSKRKRSSGQWGLVKTWDLELVPNNIELNYTYEKGFPAASNVEYLFKVTDGTGAVTERFALFDAGQSPWPQDKILLYAASHRPLLNTVNICFFPDVDYGGNFRAFITDVRKLILEGYHANNAIVDHRDDWAFYYTQDEADGLNIALDFTNPVHYPDFMKDSIISGIDAFGLIHKNEYSDGSYLYGNIHFLAQSVFTSEGKNPGTAVHETGHAVFLLSDEYNGCACFQPEGSYANVFNTKGGCEQFKKRNGLTGGCRELLNYNNVTWYTPEDSPYFPTMQACIDYNKENGYGEGKCLQFRDADGSTTFRSENGVCIMNDDGDATIYKFQATCMTVINQHYDFIDANYIAGDFEEKKNRENIFGYEPIALLELNMKDGKTEVTVKDIQYGVPQKKRRSGRDLQLSVMEKGGRVNSVTKINRPEGLEFCGGRYGGQLKEGGIHTCYVEVPYSKNLTSVKLEEMTKVNGKAFVRKGGTPQVVDLKEAFEAAYQRFEKE